MLINSEEVGFSKAISDRQLTISYLLTDSHGLILCYLAPQPPCFHRVLRTTLNKINSDKLPVRRKSTFFILLSSSFR